MKRINIQKLWRRVSSELPLEKQIIFLKESISLDKINPSRYLGGLVIVIIASYFFVYFGDLWGGVLVVFIGMAYTALVFNRFLKRYKSFLNKWYRELRR